MRRNMTRQSFLSSLLLLLSATAKAATPDKTASEAEAAFLNQYYPRQVDCPPYNNNNNIDDTTDVSSSSSTPLPLKGYVSIQDINLDIQRASSLISDPLRNLPLNEYRYIICPGTILNGEDQLTPLLHNTYIQCGGDNNGGNSLNDCIISGGMTQILLVDTSVTVTAGGTHGTATSTSSTTGTSVTRNYYTNNPKNDNVVVAAAPKVHTTAAADHPIKKFIFQGITFQESQDVSVAAVASSTTRAEFYDCHWKKGPKQQAGILIALGQAVSRPFVLPELDYQLIDRISKKVTTYFSENEDPQEDQQDDDEDNLFHHRWRDLSLWFSDTTSSSATLHRTTTSTTATATSTSSSSSSSSTTLTSLTPQIPMTVYMEDCTFTEETEEKEDDNEEDEVSSFVHQTVHGDTPDEDEIEMASSSYYRPIFNTGHIHMKNVTMNGHSSIPTSSSSKKTTRTTTTLFGMNIVHGTALIEDCTFTNNQISSIIRPIQDSLVTIRRCSFQDNYVLGTIVSVDHTNVNVEQCYFQDNIVIGGEYLLYDSSAGVIADSCFVTSSTSLDMMGYTTVLVDSTSELEERGNNYAGSLAASMAASSTDSWFSSSSFSTTLRGSSSSSSSGSEVNDENWKEARFCPPEGHILFETSLDKCLRPSSSSTSLGGGTTTEGDKEDDGCQGHCESFSAVTCPVPQLWAAAREKEEAIAAASNMDDSSSSSPSSHVRMVVSMTLLLFTTTMSMMSWY